MSLEKPTQQRSSSTFQSLFQVLYQERTTIYTLINRYQDLTKSIQQGQGQQNKELCDVVHLLIREICLHLHRKMLVLYPLIDTHMDNGINISTRSRVDQVAIETALAQCEKLPELSSEYLSKFSEALRLLSDLNSYEETQVLPQLESCMSTDEAVQKAKEYESLVSSVGTRPHPDASTMMPKAFVDQQDAAAFDHMVDKGRFSAEKSEFLESLKGKEYEGENTKTRLSSA